MMSKVVNVVQFITVLEYLLAPVTRDRAIITSLFGAIVLLETFIGCAWLLCINSTWLRWGTIAVLLLLSGVLAKVLTDRNAPGCGCFSFGKTLKSTGTDASVGLFRNAGMIWAIVWLGFTSRKQIESSATDGPRAAQAAPASRGTTLIELLVVLGVIAVLLAITLPALRAAKSSAQKTRREAGIRQLLVSLVAYTTEHDGVYPYLAVPGDPFTSATIDGWTSSFGWPYFKGQSQYWMSLMIPGYYDTRNEYVDVYFAEHQGRDPSEPNAPARVVRSLLWLSHTTAAAPRYWSAPDAPLDLGLYRAVRDTEVQAPANKGLVLDVHELALGKPALVGGCDLSVHHLDWPAEAAPSMVVGRPYGAIPWPVMSTRNGVRGFDY